MMKCWFNKYMDSNHIWKFLSQDDCEIWCFKVLIHVLFTMLDNKALIHVLIYQLYKIFVGVGELSIVLVRINCTGLLGKHHLLYKGAAGPLGLQGCATPGAASPRAATPGAVSPGAGPRGSPPPINVTPHLSIEVSNFTTIPLL
jgi:hypothetical protein